MSGTAYSQVSSLERETLIALYNSAKGLSTRWPSNFYAGTECNWFGITCSSSDDGAIRAITQIDLYGIGLTGSIPAELGNLTNLTRLDLGNNNLSGSIPAELGNLTTLSFLDLQKNSLSGSIPAELGNLTRLTRLHLNDNSLSGSIPTEMGNLTCLSRLYLNNNNLSGRIPSELGNLTGYDYWCAGLTHLYLNNNNLSGSIPSELGNLTRLAWLNLGSNSLTGVIPVELGDLTFTYFNLSTNRLIGLPQWLSDMSKGIPYTNFLITDAFIIPLIMYPMREALIALYNSTNGGNWENNSGWNGAVGTECDWHGITCSSSGVIIKLNLSNNSLSGRFPSELGNLTHLTDLYLDHNSVSGSIPAELGNITTLSHLYLHNNSLSGSIPAELGNITTLSHLYLHNNSLSGSIPAELANHPKLKTLNLSNNSLSGNIPSGSWSKMTFLYLSYNNLSGSIPSGLINRFYPTELLINSYLYLKEVSLYGNSISNLWELGYCCFKPQTDLNALHLEANNDPKIVYHGVTPDSSLGLAFNNIGVFSANDSIIYTCIRVFTDGLAGSVGGISEFDIGLTIVSLDEATVQLTSSLPFNYKDARNENSKLPDCSGKFETTTSVYTDIIEVGDSVLETTWSLIDSTNLILKLDDYKELTAN